MINGQLHDRWFNVDEVTFDEAAGSVRVRFHPEWLLEIAEVQSCELTESEGVGTYDLNKIVYSRGDRSLVVKAGIPLTFRMRVSGLDISLLELEDD